MMVGQKIWILSDLVEIRKSGIRLLDLGGMSIIHIKMRFFFSHLVDWINLSRDFLDRFLEIGIRFGCFEEIWKFLLVILIKTLGAIVQRDFGIIMICRIISKI
ncbi:hypothetical protein YC2023_070765 [Brassica napus]